MGKDKSEKLADERLQQFLGGHYGQRAETRDRYAEAIQACSNILYLDKTIAEIARMYGHTDQCLRNQLKRHFPQLLAERDRIRSILGINQYPLRGPSESITAKYASALELLRTTSLTLKEVAERCGLNVCALQQHVLFYHRDVAEKRLALRLNALDKRKMFGGISGTGRPNAPRQATAEYYAEAVEMYRTTDMTVPEIALKCGVMTHNFQAYLQRWCRGDIAIREKLRREKLELQRQERAAKGDRSRMAVANKKYTPALKMIEEGATYEEAAKALDVDVEYLYRWVKKHHPEIHRLEHQHQTIVLPEGTTCSKESWDMFKEAVKAYCETDEPMAQIAARFGLRPTSLCNFLHRKFPQTVARRKAAGADIIPV